MTSNTLQYLADPRPANFADCGFRPGQKFQVAKIDPTDLHSAWYVVMPGGSILTFNNCADDAMDEAAANWVAGALNAAMLATPQPQPPSPEQAQQSAAQERPSSSGHAVEARGLPPLSDEEILSGWGHGEIMEKTAHSPPGRALRRELEVFTAGVRFSERVLAAQADARREPLTEKEVDKLVYANREADGTTMDFVRLVEAAIDAKPDARREDAAILDWLAGRVKAVIGRTMLDDTSGPEEWRKAIRAAMNTTKGADHAE